MEKEPSSNHNEKPEEKREDSTDFIRHSKSAYKTYEKIFQSENPASGIKKDEQVTPDLPEAGVEFAKEKAEKFFETLNPEKDVLFFASSSEARAVETANIYRIIAHAKGFEVLKPENPRSKMSEDIADGEIRVLNELSLFGSSENEGKRLLIESIFNPINREKINWDGIEGDLKGRLQKAYDIVATEDAGSYGTNFVKHGEKIKEIFPEIKTAEEQFKKKFQNLKKLAKFGLKKAEESGQEKNVKILAFGHENYLLYAIEHLFQEEGIKNCETMHVEVEDDTITGRFRGKRSDL